MDKPAIDLGFEARIEMLERRIDALRALNGAFIAMSKAAPHPKEYPGDADGYAEAATLHVGMMRQAEALFDSFYNACAPFLPRH